MSTESRPDFFHDTPLRPRGIEDECTLQVETPPSLTGNRALGRYAFTIHTIDDFSDIHWLHNGGKVYYEQDLVNLTYTEEGEEIVDVERNTLEYASPEVLSGRDAAVYAAAGMQILHEAAREIAPDMRHPLYNRSAYVKVLDKDGTPLLFPDSTGHHETYATPLFREVIGGSGAQLALLSYLATRPIWAGAGIVTDTGFQLAQKVYAMRYALFDVDNVTHGRKTAFIGDKAGRGEANVEIRSGDGNMSFWVNQTKSAYTSLVLRLIEHCKFPAEAVIYDDETLVLTARQASADPNKPLPFVAEVDTAVTQQICIAQAALDFALDHPVPDEEYIAAYDVLETCKAIRTWGESPDAIELLAPRLDWAAKLQLMQQRLGIIGTNVTTSNLDAVQIDLLWEAVGKNSLSAKHYADHGNLPPEHDLKRALTTPPKTRAMRRVHELQALGNARNELASVTWQTLGFRTSRESIDLGSVYDYKRPTQAPIDTTAPPSFDLK